MELLLRFSEIQDLAEVLCTANYKVQQKSLLLLSQPVILCVTH